MSILTFDMVQLRAFERIEQEIRNAERTIKRNTLKRAARAIIDRDIKLVSEKIDIFGAPYAPKYHSSRRKIYSRIVRQIVIKSQTENDALIGFRNPVRAEIAYKQNFGMTQHYTSSRFARSTPAPESEGDSENPHATRAQARKLIQAGFKIKRGGTAWRTPTIKWIVENMKRGQAGAALRYLRGGTVDSWTTVLPQRRFFGIPADLLPELTNIALNEAQTVLNAR